MNKTNYIVTALTKAYMTGQRNRIIQRNRNRTEEQNNSKYNGPEIYHTMNKTNYIVTALTKAYMTGWRACALQVPAFRKLS